MSFSSYRRVRINAETFSEDREFVSVSPARARPITADLSGDIAPGQTIQAITGPARAAVVGKDLVLNGCSTGAGSLVIETSADAVTWGDPLVIPVDAGVMLGVRLTPTVPHYRVTFRCSAGTGTADVGFLGQAGI